ncbi:adenylyl-sulfate kinase [Arthroderma uncinatum]|uniref:adenylyl-sulfate kinase n=1 Tax=Arthroderma uncinatum TaxID=74035 RepID=UPI00144ACC87|nr:adenylyl-sulfate kinase [Arthroderma uncinatum]KAF3480148.1 adenylyl-sulfate kinase [Arthroderma uncinatum]
MGTNLTFHDSHLVTRETREEIHGQKGFTIWLTGLSASGKSTIAVELEHELLTKRGVAAYRLDGDNIRMGLNKGLGFTAEDRTENIRRIGHVAKLFADSNMIAIASFISPYAEDRQAVRDVHALSPEGKETDKQLRFIEVYVKVNVETAAERDPKGLYAKALAGEIQHFTGVSPDAPYFAPKNPEILLENDNLKIKDAVKQIMDYLDEQKLLPTPAQALEAAAKKITSIAQNIPAAPAPAAPEATEVPATTEIPVVSEAPAAN